MVSSVERPAERFVTPGVSFACIATTAAGLIKAVTSRPHSARSMAFLIALAAFHALLGTAGFYLAERRGTKTHLLLNLAAMSAPGAAAVAVGRAEAFLLLMPLVTYGVLFLSPAGAGAVAAACSAVTLTAWVSRASSVAEIVRDVAPFARTDRDHPLSRGAGSAHERAPPCACLPTRHRARVRRRRRDPAAGGRRRRRSRPGGSGLRASRPAREGRGRRRPDDRPKRARPGPHAGEGAARMIRVLIAADQAPFREGLRKVLEANGFEVVGEAADGEEAVRLASESAPDVVLMDLRMPVLDGVGATRRIAQLPRAPRVLALTTFDDDASVFDALRAGALGYLLKDTQSVRLVEAVELATRGHAWLQPSVAAKAVNELVRSPPAPGKRDVAADLGLSEREVAGVRALGAGASNKEIAVALRIAEGTVKNHVTNIFAKLKVHDRTQAALRARELGLM